MRIDAALTLIITCCRVRGGGQIRASLYGKDLPVNLTRAMLRQV
jgi:hypothetical protein